MSSHVQSKKNKGFCKHCGCAWISRWTVPCAQDTVFVDVPGATHAEAYADYSQPAKWDWDPADAEDDCEVGEEA